MVKNCQENYVSHTGYQPSLILPTNPKTEMNAVTLLNNWKDVFIIYQASCVSDTTNA